MAVCAVTFGFALAFQPSLRALPSRAVGSPVISARCVRHAAHGTSRSVLPQAAAAASVAVAEVPLLTSSNLDAWERIDDVIMGGVSSSQLVADGDAVSFEGTLREEGGGFCGQRLKLLTEPLDLSAHDGLYVDCEPEAECLRRVWKLTCRVAQDRGEVVYQAMLRPQPVGRQRLFVPWSDFQLVRGPRLVPGMPPLSVADVNATYQVSVVATKFMLSAAGETLQDFLPGRFRLRIFSLGAGGAAAAAAPGELSAAALPPAMTEEAQKASQPLPIRLLRPVLGLLFGEARRRRRAATLLLQARGLGPLQRARYGWALKRAGGRTGLPRAVARTVAPLAQDALALMVSLPARLLFKLVVTLIKAARWVRSRLGGAPPKMPPLSTA